MKLHSGTFIEPKLVRPQGPSENWPENGTDYFPFTDVGMSTMVLSIPYSLGEEHSRVYFAKFKRGEYP